MVQGESNRSGESKDTHQKALALNLDATQYGTVAEIGAGQETARWFFRVGGASGTIAKAMSAYDMKFSDAIYGEAPRYVSRKRLHQMLDHEYALLSERLGERLGATTSFFAFANTVVAKAFSTRRDGHGWLGIRFQHAPQAEPSQIDLHVCLRGNEAAQDQETLGILGVNVIYGAMNLHADPDALLGSMMDGLSDERLEIDMADFRGPAFEMVDNRIIALRLVQKGLSKAAMFDAAGEVVQPAAMLHHKAVLVERSRYKPPTRLTVSLLESAQRAFEAEADVGHGEVVALSEMTLHDLRDERAEIQIEDFLQRADILGMLGKNVMISSYGEFYRLAGYLFRLTDKPVGIAMGVPALRELFKEKYYAHLAGGILESFGRLFKNDLRLYVCPEKERASGRVLTADNLDVAPHLVHLLRHLLQNARIRPLESIDEGLLTIHADEVLKEIAHNDAAWEQMVPESVAAMIKTRGLFGYRG